MKDQEMSAALTEDCFWSSERAPAKISSYSLYDMTLRISAASALVFLLAACNLGTIGAKSDLPAALQPAVTGGVWLCKQRGYCTQNSQDSEGQAAFYATRLPV